MTSARPAPLREVPYQAMDSFVIRRRGMWHWQVLCVSAVDGIERECAAGAKFYRSITAERVRVGMLAVQSAALWRAGAHPLQHGGVPVVAVGGGGAQGGAHGAETG